jgi:hypothetical protein
LLKDVPASQLREAFDDDRLMKRVLDKYLEDENTDTDEPLVDTTDEVIDAAKKRLTLRVSRDQQRDGRDRFNG